MLVFKHILSKHCRIPVSSLQAEPRQLASNKLNEILRTVGLGYETELLFGSLFRYILTNLSQHIMQPTTEENWREGHCGGTTQREQQLCDFLAQAWDQRAYRPSGDSGSGPVTKWEPHTHYPLLRTTQGAHRAVLETTQSQFRLALHLTVYSGSWGFP